MTTNGGLGGSILYSIVTIKGGLDGSTEQYSDHKKLLKT